jgi:succinate dehydrogenase/fumarate reductase flavoprotein subunit
MPGREYDVVVVGSGAAGLATAITAAKFGLSVLILEKAAVIGGTTALSGGWLWVPGTTLARDAGASDTLDAARLYIQTEARNHFDAARVDSFLANGAAMVDFFRKNTAVDFNFGLNYPDYHPDRAGAVEQGRSLHTKPYDGAKLGKALAQLGQPMPESTFLGMGLNSGPDLKHFLNATRSVRSASFVAGRIASHGISVVRHGRGTRLVNGNALAARLFRTILDLNIPYRLSTRAIELVRNGEVVTGLIVESEGKRETIIAKRGIVLAAGGFPQDHQRRAQLFEHTVSEDRHVSLAPSANTGDGVTMASAVGAHINNDLSNAAAWAPVSIIKRRDGSVGRFFHLIDRAKPGVIAVTPRGERFVNESENYHDFVRAMIDAARGQVDASAFLICDHRALRRYGLGAVRPFPLPYQHFLKSGYLRRGLSIGELAQAIGIDPDRLARTVDEVNDDARHGRDRFGKGSTSYQRLLGDPDFRPNPCIGEIKNGPYYAVKIVPGDLGTYYGLLTDSETRVLDAQHKPIPNLYSVGNDAASIFGGSYPGAGATLGPAMTFGYICGRRLAGAEPQRSAEAPT